MEALWKLCGSSPVFGCFLQPTMGSASLSGGGHCKNSEIDKKLWGENMLAMHVRRTEFEFGEGLLTPPNRRTEGLPVNWRPPVGGVARSETGQNRLRPLRGRRFFWIRIVPRVSLRDPGLIAGTPSGYIHPADFKDSFPHNRDYLAVALSRAFRLDIERFGEGAGVVVAAADGS